MLILRTQTPAIQVQTLTSEGPWGFLGLFSQTAKGEKTLGDIPRNLSWFTVPGSL